MVLAAMSSTALTSVLANPEIIENTSSLTQIVILFEFVSRVDPSGCNTILLLGNTNVFAGGGVAGPVHPLGDFAFARILWSGTVFTSAVDAVMAPTTVGGGGATFNSDMMYARASLSVMEIVLGGRAPVAEIVSLLLTSFSTAPAFGGDPLPCLVSCQNNRRYCAILTIRPAGLC
jgi:hypothetical protein